jgi:hypothetical protein
MKGIKHFVAALSVALSFAVQAQQTTETIQTGHSGKHISPDLFGVFFEDLSRRYLAATPNEPGPVRISATGPTPARKGGECVKWKVVE